MWKECSRCETYLISTDGKVKNKKTNRILKPKLDKNGYETVALSLGKRGKRKFMLIHKLVAEEFVPNPYNKPEVIHLDRNKRNNDSDNLKWVTEQERVLYAKTKGEKRTDYGSTSPNAKLTDLEVIYCRMLYNPKDKRYNCNALAKKFGVANTTMYYILNNITYVSPSNLNMI